MSYVALSVYAVIVFSERYLLLVLSVTVIQTDKFLSALSLCGCHFC